ncbi:MAG: DUF2167 domain-containing protein [Leptospirales bacterium]
MYIRLKKWTAIIIFSASAVLTPLTAEQSEQPMSEQEWNQMNAAMEKKIARFKYKTGTIQIGDNLATVHIPKGYKYLGAADSRYIIEDYWGNYPDESVLGMLFLDNESPLNGKNSYSVVLAFTEEGYIDDEDAQDLDYDELLEQMQEDSAEFNKQLVEEGYAKTYLIGWAQKPYYDSVNKKLHWAKEVAFEGQPTNTLNYDIRILGRHGVLSLVIISDIGSLATVKSDINIILESTDFNEGQRYEDYEEGVDSVAAYGLGALVAGKVLSKVGLFALLGKFGKIIIAGLIAAGIMIKKFFFGSKEEKVKSIEKAD